MKYKLLRFSLLSMLVMFFGGLAFAQDEPAVTLDFTSQDNWNIPTSGNANTELKEFTDGTYTIKLFAANNYKLNNGYLILGKEGSFLQLPEVDFDVAKIEVVGTSGASEYVKQVITNDHGALVCATETTGAKNVTNVYELEGANQKAGVYRIQVTSNHNTQISKVFIYKADASDTRQATTITLGEYETTGEVGGSMNLPSATVTTASGTPLDVAVTWSSSDPEVASIGETAAVINFLAPGTVTITASYAGDENTKPSSASFKLIVTAAAIDETFTSLKALQEAATATSTPVTIQFNNVFVTAVKNNNAYLADADGYGVLVYQKDHGLEAGQVLNGTINANLVLYRGQTEITGFSTEGLTITTTELTPTEKTIDAITAANQSTLVTLKGVTFSNGKLSDGTNEITYFDNFSAGTLEEGATYDITGIVIVYNTTLEIAPRTADDIVKTSGEQPDERLDLTLSFPQERYEATMGEDFEEPVLSGKPDDYDGMLSYKSSDASVATVSYEGEVTLVAPGTVTITAEAMASQTYKEAEASYTLIVNERETPPEPGEIANPYTYTFESKTFDAEGIQMLANANWTLSTDAGYFGYDGTKGQQFGSSKAPATTITLSTSDIPGTITKVVVNTSGASAIDATFAVSVGETAFQYAGDATAVTTSAALTNTATDYEFTGSASGAITLSWANNSEKAIYVKSIYVEYTTEDTPVEPAGWRDIKLDLTNGNLLEESELVQWGAINAFGIAVAADGTVSRVAADAANAACVVSGKWHSNQCWAALNVTVNVEGPVKVTCGTQPWSGSPVTIKAGDETVASFSNQGNLWSATATGNVVAGYYRGPDAATLTIDGGGYPTYIAIEAVDPATIPNEATLTFDVANAGAEGLAPAAKKVEIGTKVTIPANTTLYKEGYTLTAWADATGAQYVAGQEVQVNEDITLLPVFTENAASFADRTAETTITWQFGEGNGVGTLNAQGKSTILVAQAAIAGGMIDVKMDIDATNGKINNVGRGDKWAQCNDGTVLTIPAYKGTAVSFDSYSEAAGTTIGGVEATDKAATYEGTAETLDIVAKGIGYIASVTAVYPVPTGDEPVKVDVNVAFSIEGTECQGQLVAESGAYKSGDDFTLPAKNFTLYKEGFTQTGWTDGENTYEMGKVVSLPEKDITFVPVFTENKVNLNDRTEAVTVKWNFRRDAGAPTVAWEGKDGLVWVAQAKVNGQDIDVALPFSTNPGKFANGNWTDWAQLNQGTTFHVPSAKGAVISMEAYGDITTTTIDGQSDYTQGKTISYTIGGAAESVDVVIGDGSYYRYIQVVLPKVEQQQGGSFDNVAGTINWLIGDEQVPTISNEIAGAISGASVSAGSDLTISSAKYFDTEMVHYTPKTSNAGNVEGVMIEYRVKPLKGITFQPTQIDYAAVKVGTDNATYSWSYTVDGVESTITQIDPKPDLLRNNGSNSVENGGTAKLMHTETFANVGPCDEFTFRFYISACANNKNICIGNVTISGIVNGESVSVNMYDLATVVSPEEAGSINVYPKADQYEEGSEVTLTATENFGYNFVNWTNAAGEEVSADAKFKYTVNADETLTANFVAVETYELSLAVDGTNDYMVTISPDPTMVDGKMMYEEGTAVQLTANQYEGLVTFTNWSDGETNSSKIVSMTEDIQLTAMYAEADIIAGWDFYTAGGSGRKADFAAEDNDGDALNLVNTETGETSGWLDKSWLGAGGYESFKGAAVNWKTGSGNGDVGHWHWQTKVNAEAFTDINVQFQMLYNYNAYQTYNAEYSLDGESWTKFGSITMSGTKAPASFSEQLPAEANNQTDLYIRMLADKTSNVDGAASANDGNTLAMFFITGTPKLIDDGKAPELVSTVPADGATGASASGKIVLTFDERVKLADTFMPTGYINDVRINSNMQNPVTPIVNGKTVTFEYKGLEYSTEYAFRLPGGSIADLTNNFIEDEISFTFTTMERPTVDKKMYDYVVENVDDLLAAISAAQARSDKNVRYRIFIKNGNYTIPLKENNVVAKAEGYEVPECITFINTQNLSLIGESRDGVIITNGIDPTNLFNGQYGKTSKYDGIGNSDVFQISGSDYYFQDLTIESGMADATGRDLAVQDKATRTIYKNTGLRGYQDTWTSNNDNGLYYFEDGYVRGRTDYMCGKGDAFFNGVELRQIAGGYAAVPSKSIKYGFTYKDCVINGEPAVVNYATGETRSAADVDGNYTLGRPWGSGTPVALFIDTHMNVVPSAIGWNEMGTGWPKRFAEYNSMTSTGSQIDLSGRKKTFGDGHENNPVLTAEEALEAGNLHNMFGEWDPTLATEQAPVPTNVELTTVDKQLTWTDSNYALLYAIVKDGKVVDFTLDNSYTVDDVNAVWTIRAANEMGGLGEASDAASVTTGITTVETSTPVFNGETYTMQGIRVNKAQKGLYIVNGRKVVMK